MDVVLSDPDVRAVTLVRRLKVTTDLRRRAPHATPVLPDRYPAKVGGVRRTRATAKMLHELAELLASDRPATAVSFFQCVADLGRLARDEASHTASGTMQRAQRRVATMQVHAAERAHQEAHEARDLTAAPLSCLHRAHRAHGTRT
jgi:hypothetical protein